MGTDAELTWEAPGPGYWEWQGPCTQAGIPGRLIARVWPTVSTSGLSRCFERIHVPAKSASSPSSSTIGLYLFPVAALVGSEATPASEAADVAGLCGCTRSSGDGPRRLPAHFEELDVAGPHRGVDEHAAAHSCERRTERCSRRTSAPSTTPRCSTICGERTPTPSMGTVLHFDLHGDDLGPLGLYLVSCQDWGIAPGEAIALAATHRAPRPRWRLCGRSGSPSSRPDGRATGRPPAPSMSCAVAPAAVGLDDYLQEFGWRAVTGYDLDGRTAGELPEALLANVLASTQPFDEAAAAAAGRRHRAPRRVPVMERASPLAPTEALVEAEDDNGRCARCDYADLAGGGHLVGVVADELVACLGGAAAGQVGEVVTDLGAGDVRQTEAGVGEGGGSRRGRSPCGRGERGPSSRSPSRPARSAHEAARPDRPGGTRTSRTTARQPTSHARSRAGGGCVASSMGRGLGRRPPGIQGAGGRGSPGRRC